MQQGELNMMQSFLSIEQLSRKALTRVFHHARNMQAGVFNRQAAMGKILIPLFFEPSTRTRLSFETAILRLGGQVLPVPVTNALSTSKGESLPDTIRVISGFGDILVMRHADAAALYLAGQYASIPIINCGNGCDEHPTQTLLDLFTIEHYKGTIDGLSIGLVGDLKYARTMHSLAQGLSQYQVRLNLVSPEELRLPASIRQKLQCEVLETSDLREVLGELDVLYIVMLQHHRIVDPILKQHLKAEYYRLTPDTLRHAKPDMILLHPLVRQEEVSVEVDALPHAVYFEQAQNGVFVRMALIDLILREEIAFDAPTGMSPLQL
jgi:aspartate carbamoyltransferase catalytic subunit